MPLPHLSVGDAFERLHAELELAWLDDQAGGERRLTRDAASGQRPRLLGPLNFNGPNRIQLLGAAEARMFSAEGSLAPERFEYDLAADSDAFVVTDGLAPPAPLVAFARERGIALFGSGLRYSELQKRMRHELTRALAEREIIHGVMMDVHGTGVLMTGDASVGKSELALELVSRGHILVADDAPEFTRIAPGTIECRCPTLLRDFLEVRGIGVLNIARMYGDAHTRARKVLRFIVHLQAVGAGRLEGLAFEGDRMAEPSTVRRVLGVDVPERTIPVAPGRNIAVLVEAAVRDQILRAGGYSATRDLVDSQARRLAASAARPAEPEA